MSNNQTIVLVTGASSGLGKTTAEHLASKGFYVFASAPSSELDKLEAMRSANIEPLELDITDDNMITAAIDHIQSTKGRLDVLVNNAGYGLYGSIEGLTIEQVQHCFNVNVFGTGRMIQAVLPMMRGQKSGKIINVTSVVGKISTPMLGWYAATKHALEALSDALRLEVAALGITVVIIEPGTTRTGFEEISMDILAKSDDPADYDEIKEKFRVLNRNGFKKAPGPEGVAHAIHHAVVSKRPKIRYRVGQDAKIFITVKQMISDRLMDRLIR
ncbi:MAG: NAD(P)-dependent dehydrogenase (short-subunit alcohol dehydrogenase family), partial [Candidatus Promineifilaceae bacterium]